MNEQTMKNLFKYIFFLTSIVSANSGVIKNNDSYILSDKIVVKLKESSSLAKQQKQLSEKLGGVNLVKVFDQNKFSTMSILLDNIYYMEVNAPYDINYFITEVNSLPQVEWAEPYYLYKPSYIPNDPFYNGSDISKYNHLNVISAEQAWDINKGSSDVIIAIVDTGVDWEHPDLNANIWINPNEIEGNGVDDDNNGFVDDIRGWDFGGLDGTADNNPKEDASDHGTHVAGLASAVTDNSIGIASIGFNCKLMAVKTSRNDVRDENNNALIYSGYEGIKYAADNGAKIINCSWGGYSYSHFAQSVIDYATSKGALVVAAAGNDNSNQPHYPSSYKGVLSVAATDNNDIKASWSNYGTKVDVCAPGVSVYSTWQTQSLYTFLSGTSMASPIVAGLAGLVASQFPSYSPLQLAEQIRVTSDNIDNLNLSFSNQIGYGRVNAYTALGNNSTKSARITNYFVSETGDGDGIYESGETLDITVELTNYLSPLSNLQLNMSSTNSNIKITNNSVFAGTFNTLESKSLSSTFKILINNDAEDNIDLKLLVSLTDNSYNDYDWIELSINPTYEIHRTENLSLTFNSNGSIGFDDYPNNQKGSGLIYKNGPNLMFEGALIYGTSESSIVSSARDIDGNKDLDFTTIIPIELSSPGEFSDKQTYTKISDISASPQSLGIETEIYTYSFAEEIDANYIIMRYIFNNTTSTNIDSFYAGQYWDFDMDGDDFADDRVDYDSNNNFGYIFDNDGTPVNTYVGLALLSSGNISFFAMNDKGKPNPTISWDGFSDTEKWIALTSGLSYTTSPANDISAFIGSGPHFIPANSNLEIYLAVAAGDNLTDLTQTINRAKIQYLNLPTNVKENHTLPLKFSLNQNYPNPFNPTTTINYSIPQNLDENIGLQKVHLNIYDLLGRKVKSLVNEYQNPGKYSIKFDANNLTSGVYYYQLRVDNFVSTKKMVLVK